MKNFKRVISAVIALALSASSLVAVSAGKFSDVADTASCAEAVDVLTALNIVNGYEDGTFKPEGEITRAEAATMIVGALNMVNEAKSAAGTSQFADVNEKANWATGYVNVGVAQGFISGMGDGTFAPQDNVTYAQMCVMLTKITGYADYAASYGGWPTGYTSMAANAGINKGVAAANDAKLTRGQVAQMLYNALTAPMLVVTEYALDGNKYGKADGTKSEFKTLLSDKFDGYLVSASIQATANDSGMSKGEATIQLEKKDYTDEVTATYNTNVAGSTRIPVKTDLSLEEYKFQSGNAIIVKDVNDKWTLISFISNSKLETKEYALDEFVDSATVAATSTSTDATLKFDNTTVKVPGSAVLYINGANKGTIFGMTASYLNDQFKEAQGTVKVVKNTNGKIDKVMIDVYLLGKVDGVDYKNGKTTVSFASKTTAATTGINLRKISLTDDAVADDEAEVTVTRDGEACELKDLQVDDVIAIYYAFTAADQEVTDPKSMKILATTAKDEGSLTVSDTTENEFVLNGNEYSAVLAADFASQNVGSTLKVFLDPFGRLYSIDESKTSDKYGIVTYFDYDDQVTILTEDGTSKSYTVASGEPANVGGAATAGNIQDRVIKYQVRTRTNEIYNIQQVAAARQSTISDEYKAATNKVASISISDSTFLVDATKCTVSTNKASDLGTYAELKDGVGYEVYAWDKSATSNVFGLVIVKKAGTTISEDSRFAVAKKTINSATVLEDEIGFAVTALYDGAEQVLEIAGDARVYKSNGAVLNADKAWDDESSAKAGRAVSSSSLAAGDMFFFTTDSDNLIDAIYVVGNDFVTVANIEGTVKGATWDNTLKNASHLDVQLVKDVIVTSVTGSNVQFAIPSVETTGVPAALVGKYIINKNLSDQAGDALGVYDYPISSDCVVYTKDLDGTYNKAADKFYEGGAVKASNFSRFQFKDDSSYIWCKTSSDAADASINSLLGTDDYRTDYITATALIVDGVIVEIYQTIH